MVFSNLTLKIYRQGRGQGSRSRLYIQQIKRLIHNGLVSSQSDHPFLRQSQFIIQP